MDDVSEGLPPEQSPLPVPCLPVDLVTLHRTRTSSAMTLSDRVVRSAVTSSSSSSGRPSGEGHRAEEGGGAGQWSLDV